MVHECGRKTDVFGTWRPRALEHDVLGVTNFAIAYREFAWERGNDLECNADAIMSSGDERLFVEVEHEMSYGRIREKLQRNYRNGDGLLLVVAKSEHHRHGIINACESIKVNIGHIALFGVLPCCQQDPYGVETLCRLRHVRPIPPNPQDQKGIEIPESYVVYQAIIK